MLLQPGSRPSTLMRRRNKVVKDKITLEGKLYCYGGTCISKLESGIAGFGWRIV